MSESDKPVGFALQYAAVVDTENQDQLQISANGPLGASASDLAVIIATMRDAVWLERLACNERILKRTELIATARDARVAEFEARGETVDAEMLSEERAITNATVVKLTSKLDAERALSNGHSG